MIKEEGPPMNNIVDEPSHCPVSQDPLEDLQKVTVKLTDRTKPLSPSDAIIFACGIVAVNLQAMGLVLAFYASQGGRSREFVGIVGLALIFAAPCLAAWAWKQGRAEFKRIQEGSITNPRMDLLKNGMRICVWVVATTLLAVVGGIIGGILVSCFS
jgi:hypothetical protein